MLALVRMLVKKKKKEKVHLLATPTARRHVRETLEEINTFCFPYTSSNKEIGDGGLRAEKKNISMQLFCKS